QLGASDRRPRLAKWQLKRHHARAWPKRAAECGRDRAWDRGNNKSCAYNLSAVSGWTCCPENGAKPDRTFALEPHNPHPESCDCGKSTSRHYPKPSVLGTAREGPGRQWPDVPFPNYGLRFESARRRLRSRAFQKNP